MIYGVIDIGSNSIRLSVYKVCGEIVHNLFNEKAMAGLGSLVVDKKLSEEGIQVLTDTLVHLKSIVDNFDSIDKVFVFATASLRNVENTMEIIQRVKMDTDYNIELLSGEEEALLSFIGACQSVHADKGVLADIGGGSTEIVLFEDKKILESDSMEYGSLNMYTKFVADLLPTEKERKAIGSSVRRRIGKMSLEIRENELLCIVGGSGRATLKLYNHFFKKDRNNSIMVTEDIGILIKNFEKIGFRQSLNLILKVKADRVHTLIPGMIMLYKIAKAFNSDVIAVSQTGIREGYVYKKILGRDD